DFGGGGMLLAMGVLAALVERIGSGKGQVIDAAMLEGATQLGAFLWGLRKSGVWKNERGMNILDTGSHFYNTYECKDGKFISIGSIEPQFYAELLELTGLTKEELPKQMDRTQWPAMKQKLAGVFKTRTRDEWTKIMGMSDVCFAPVLDMQEAEAHPHNKARKMFVEVGGIVQPAPAPRFSRTPSKIQGPPAQSGEHTDATLAAFGFSKDEIGKLRQAQAIA
ncbi:MAG: CoA transferase, partial [Candidatus Lambdaproteobacteria bacterium]|nr:CoA transferase [Candidatus Lambdaproteobacteria bacterium]